MPSNRALRAVAFSFLLSVFGLPAYAADNDIRARQGKEQVTIVIGQFVSAWNRNDIDALTSLFTPTGTFKSPAGDGAQGRAGIHKLLAREHREIFRESTLAATPENIVFPKPGLANAIGAYTLSGIPVMFGIEVSREGKFDFRLTRLEGRWFIASARIAKE